jgi:alcohol dehydrogenase, propanol-preferring
MHSERIATYGKPLQGFDEPTPQPSGTQVLVRVTGCGVCHSDLHFWEGFVELDDGVRRSVSRAHTLPFTLGHEIVGVVEQLGPEASGCSVGDTAVVYPWIGCGECPVCRSGEEHLCATPAFLGVHRHGGFATHVIVPHARYLFATGTIDPVLAATYACSGLTAYSALKKVAGKADGKHLLVIGAGGVGLAGISIARAIFDGPIIVVDIDKEKREAAMAAGAQFAFDPNEDSAKDQIISITDGGAPAAVDFVGSGKSATFGFHVLRSGGLLVVVGLFGGTMSVPAVLFPMSKLTVQGSFVGSPGEMKELMQLARDGKIGAIPVETRPLESAEQTLQDLKNGRIVGRAVLTP